MIAARITPASGHPSDAINATIFFLIIPIAALIIRCLACCFTCSLKDDKKTPPLSTKEGVCVYLCLLSRSFLCLGDYIEIQFFCRPQTAQGSVVVAYMILAVAIPVVRQYLYPELQQKLSAPSCQQP